MNLLALSFLLTSFVEGEVPTVVKSVENGGQRCKRTRDEGLAKCENPQPGTPDCNHLENKCIADCHADYEEDLNAYNQCLREHGGRPDAPCWRPSYDDVTSCEVNCMQSGYRCRSQSTVPIDQEAINNCKDQVTREYNQCVRDYLREMTPWWEPFFGDAVE